MKHLTSELELGVVETNSDELEEAQASYVRLELKAFLGRPEQVI